MSLPIGRRTLLGAALGLAFAGAATAPARAGLVEVIAAARSSVLAVGVYNPTASPRFGFRGSGFVVGDGNLVVTSAHVLPGIPDTAVGVRLVVQLPRGPLGLETRNASVERVDPEHDLALLRIEGAALPTLTIAPPASVREGLAIALLGYPIAGALGYSLVTHRGIVSSITAIAPPMPTAGQLNARTIARLRSGSFDIYQLDATAYPGNSGGPVLDAETGQVVGIVNLVLVRGTRESALSNPTGITYAIPGRYALELLQPR